MKNRDKMAENYKRTEYFDDKEKAGDKPSMVEIEARTFKGMVNVYLKEKELKYNRITELFGIDYGMFTKKYMQLPYKKNGVKNKEYRAPSLGLVIATAISLMLNIEQLNRLLESANMPELKRWRYYRGDDIILKHYDKIIDQLGVELDEADKKGIGIGNIVISEIQIMNDEFKDRKLDPLISFSFYGGK